MLSLILKLLISIREFSRRNLFFYFLGLCLENRAKNRFHAEVSESIEANLPRAIVRVRLTPTRFIFLKFRHFHRKEEKKLGIYIVFKNFCYRDKIEKIARESDLHNFLCRVEPPG